MESFNTPKIITALYGDKVKTNKCPNCLNSLYWYSEEPIVFCCQCKIFININTGEIIPYNSEK